MTRPRRGPGIARRLGLERNELRRPADRVEALITTALLFGVLVGLPMVSVTTVRATQDAQLRADRAVGTRHRIPAELTADAPGPQPAPASAPARSTAAARWKYAGVEHTGRVPVRAGSKAGSTVAVWVDDTGAIASAPSDRGQAVRTSLLLGLLAGLGLGTVLWCARRLVRWVFIRRHLPAWEAGWALVAPDWTTEQR